MVEGGHNKSFQDHKTSHQGMDLFDLKNTAINTNILIIQGLAKLFLNENRCEKISEFHMWQK